MIYRLDEVPTFWWDEGWALSLARNSVELGHYGHLLLGERIPVRMMSTGWPAVAPAIASFRLLGIGVWQGRLPYVFITTGSLIILYRLATCLYNHKVALGAVFFSLTLLGHPQVNPILLGRQVLGEVPAVFFLLLGYWLFIKGNLISIVGASLSWGLALQTKIQVLPFFIFSLCFYYFLPIISRKPHINKTVGSSMIGGLAVHFILSIAREHVLSSGMVSASPQHDPTLVIRDWGNLFTYVIVMIPSIRLSAILWVILGGVPTLVGLWYTRPWKGSTNRQDGHETRTAGLHLVWGLSASWLVWFILLSVDWPRYLFVPLFLGSIFCSAACYNMNQLNPVTAFRRALKALRPGGHPQQSITDVTLFVSWIACLISSAAIIIVLMILPADNSASDMSQYVNTYTNSNAIIETHESELFLFIQRPYHFPPDEAVWNSQGRKFRGQEIDFIYDPLAHDPDYLIIGWCTRDWPPYVELAESGTFSRIHTVGGYDLYKRIQ
jgi:hypothetical protein